jgi:hypothetical protein
MADKFQGADHKGADHKCIGLAEALLSVSAETNFIFLMQTILCVQVLLTTYTWIHYSTLHLGMR